jgi:hypothetical protein
MAPKHDGEVVLSGEDDVYPLRQTHPNIMDPTLRSLVLGTLILPYANFNYMTELSVESEEFYNLQTRLPALGEAEWLGIYPGTNVRYEDLINDLLRIEAEEELQVILGASRRGDNVLVFLQITIGAEGIHLGSGYKDCLTRLFRCLRHGIDGKGVFLTQPTVSALWNTLDQLMVNSKRISRQTCLNYTRRYPVLPFLLYPTSTSVKKTGKYSTATSAGRVQKE